MPIILFLFVNRYICSKKKFIFLFCSYFSLSLFGCRRLYCSRLLFACYRDSNAELYVRRSKFFSDKTNLNRSITKRYVNCDIFYMIFFSLVVVLVGYRFIRLNLSSSFFCTCLREFDFRRICTFASFYAVQYHTIMKKA